jgi:LytS/YehU family sensor histidine kinase
LEGQLAQAQLQALKMQLHPHFLFNTLNSISALLHKDVDAADEMIGELGDFLRMTLENDGAQTVRLEQELEFLKSYLEIERVRFQDRLTIGFAIDPDTLDAYVPNLILQPIIENAIRYAIAPRAEQGMIEVSARQKNGRLRITVRDDGPGLTHGNGFTEGIGLANTRARLRQLYEGSHEFQLTNSVQGGLGVTLEIPFQLAEVVTEKVA